MTDALGAVAEATASVSRLYPLGSVPAKPLENGEPYGSYSATLGRGDTYTLSAEGVRWGRVVVQTFAHTAAGALDKSEQVRTALAGTRLDITGYDATPCRVELDPTFVRDPDDSTVIGVTTTYTFTATKGATP